MQELEKILEEICGKAIELKNIIRKHMNDGWISVEKDLPKNGSEVWVVLESTYGTGYRIYSSARYLYFENYGESHWCDNHYGYLEWEKYSDGHGGSSAYKVIAWQPLKPYRPERCDDHDGNETLKIAIHCLGVLAEQEVCEECPVYNESGIACREVAREAISALKEIQKYRSIGELFGESDIKLNGGK